MIHKKRCSHLHNQQKKLRSKRTDKGLWNSSHECLCFRVDIRGNIYDFIYIRIIFKKKGA